MVNYVKKITLFTFLLIALTFSIPLMSVKGVLTVGDEFEYEVKKAYGNFNYTNTTATVSGQTDQFRIGDNALDEGDKFTVVVDSVSTNVGFSIYDSTESLLLTISASSFAFALNLLIT